MRRSLAGFRRRLTVGGLSAAEPTTADQLFADGSVIALIGDSITHGGRWHRYVAEYIATRFPDRSIRFLNGGIAGDSASGVLTRLDRDDLYPDGTIPPLAY